MALLSALSTQNKTDLRAGGYRVQQFLAVCPNDILVQFTPSAANTELVYAEIPVGSVSSGSMSNIATFQTVIYSTSTNYADTEQYRTYVRKVDGTTSLYVGQAGQSFTTSTVITVLNTYDVLAKPRVIRNGVEYADWEIGFRRSLPIEDALPSAVVLTDGVISYNPAPSPVATDHDATSTFTHSWTSSNSNDSVIDDDTGSPAFTLEAASFRWIRYTFTDSNGNSNLRVIGLWTVPAGFSHANVIAAADFSGSFAEINFDPELGPMGSVPAFGGVSGLLDNTFCAVFCVEIINNTQQFIRSNIDFAGYLSNDTTAVRGDERYGRISESRLAMDGFGAMLSQTPVPTLDITRTSSPVVWGDIENPTPCRMAVYILSEHTTLLHLCALSIPTDDDNFTARSDLFDNQEMVGFDAVASLADMINAKLQFDRPGQIHITRRIVHLNTAARDSAPTVVDFALSDLVGDLAFESGERTVNLLTVAGGYYDTAADDYVVYQATVPPYADIRGTDQPQVVNQLLTADAGDSAAQVELAQRAANRYAALSPTWTARGTLKDEWGFMMPDVGSWITLPLDATDTPLGKTFTASDRWQIIEIGTQTNNTNGTRSVPFVARLETQFTGANIDVARLEANADGDVKLLPATLPPYTGATLDQTGGDWFDTQDATPSIQQPAPAASGCENVGFRVKDNNGVETTNSALNGENISVVVRGSGVVEGSTGVSLRINYTPATVAPGIGPFAVEKGGTVRLSNANNYTGWGPGKFTDHNGVGQNGNTTAYDPGALLPSVPLGATLGRVGTTGNWFFIGIDNTVEIPETGDLYLITNDTDWGDNAGIHQIDRIIAPPGKNGDAFYTWASDSEPTPYDPGVGLKIEGSVPASIPPYNGNHEYEILQTVTSGPIQLVFQPPNTYAEMSNWSIQAIVCFNGVP